MKVLGDPGTNVKQQENFEMWKKKADRQASLGWGGDTLMSSLGFLFTYNALYRELVMVATPTYQREQAKEF